MKNNFNNQNFEWLFQDITSSMPKIIFTGIIFTYLITAALNVYFLPLPLMLSIPASLMLQFGRFAVVFIDFLNPSDKRSKYPPRVAAIATVIALLELWFSIQGQTTGAEFWAMFFFIGAIICFGYVLEIQFIEKGIEAYGIGVKEPKQRRRRVVRETTTTNISSTQPIKFTMAVCFMFAVYLLPAQSNHFMAFNWMSVEKIGGDKLERTYYDRHEDKHYIDTITNDFLSSWNFWDGYTLPVSDNDLFMTYGTQTLKYNKKTQLWTYKEKSMDYVDLLKFLVRYTRKNFIKKKVQW
jgi:uncharacterized membrane protein YhaH (DUF805 family)